MASNIHDFHTDSPSLVGSWSCVMCSADGVTSEQSLCATCQQQIRQSIVDFSADQNALVWDCPRCTLVNEITHEKCNACGQAKLTANLGKKTLVNTETPLPHVFKSLTVRDRRHRDENRAERIFEQIVQNCRKEKINFIDDQFVPAERSLGPGSFQHATQWLRISDVAPFSHHDRKLEWTIFSSPQPSDIQQGALGNCWLVAVLALITERPRLLEHILLTKKINEEGVYLVRICHNGLWQDIIIDDCFPCTSHKHLVFTQAKRCQLYVPLIEKACAKVFGSYGNLTSGNLLEGLQLLTGAPCDYIDLKSTNYTLDSDIVWAKLISACESNLLIGTSTSGTGMSAEEYKNVHINRDHAYSLLATHTLNVEPHRFVLVRDPHSHSRYAEDAVAGSVLKQLRAVNPADRSTGAFWISWPRFLQYFSCITISTYNSDYFDVRERGKFTRSSTDLVNSYRFHISQTSMINISLLYHRQNRTTRNFHTQAFVLCDANDLKAPGSIGQRYSMSVCKRGGFTHWAGSLQAGYYVLIPFSTSFWRNDNHQDFTVVIHSSANLSLTMKKKSSTFLADCLISAIMRMCEHPTRANDLAFYKPPKNFGMKLVIAENSSTTRHLSVTNKIITARNIRHSRHAHLPCRTDDCIPPQHRQLLYITEWTDTHGQTAEFRCEFNYYHKTEKSEPNPRIDISHGDLHSPRKIQF